MNATSNQAMTSQAGASPLANPWVQLIIGIICMVMIANMQYGWTLFVGPIGNKYHWTKAAIQVAFTVFVLFETWLNCRHGDRQSLRRALSCGDRQQLGDEPDSLRPAREIR